MIKLLKVTSLYMGKGFFRAKLIDGFVFGDHGNKSDVPY